MCSTIVSTAQLQYVLQEFSLFFRAWQPNSGVRTDCSDYSTVRPCNISQLYKEGFKIVFRIHLDESVGQSICNTGCQSISNAGIQSADQFTHIHTYTHRRRHTQHRHAHNEHRQVRTWVLALSSSISLLALATLSRHRDCSPHTVGTTTQRLRSYPVVVW